MAAYTLSPDGTTILASASMDPEALGTLAVEAALAGLPIELLDAELGAMETISAYLDGYGRTAVWSPTSRIGVWLCEHGVTG